MTPQPRIKVLFLTSSYPRNEHDTAAIFLRYLANALATRGLDIDVLAPADGSSETTDDANVMIHRFQYFPMRWQSLAYGSGIMPNLERSPRLWLQVPFFFLAMTLSALRLIARRRYDLVHAHWILPQGLVGLLASSAFRIPLVVTAHGTDAFSLHGTIPTWLKKLILAKCNTWTTNTRSTAAAVLRQSSLPQPTIIPMGVDIELFSGGNPAPLRAELPQSEQIVLFVGRLIESKGCDQLLKAIALLPTTTQRHTTFWIVGDGDQKSHLEHIIKNIGVAEKVRFFGTISHVELPHIYAAADIVVVPSKSGAAGEAEGQGVVILEAFAARACVLATSVGGITSMVRDRINGLLVQPDDPEALADALAELLSSPDLRKQLAANGFTDVKNHYSWSRIASDFISLYTNFIKT
jgi:glycosyltransferase involved in cell wall biosynthesis